MFWQKPETWAEGINKCASDSGRIGAIETVEDLMTGYETTGEGYYGMLMNSLLMYSIL